MVFERALQYQQFFLGYLDNNDILTYGAQNRSRTQNGLTMRANEICCLKKISIRMKNIVFILMALF